MCYPYFVWFWILLTLENNNNKLNESDSSQLKENNNELSQSEDNNNNNNNSNESNDESKVKDSLDLLLRATAHVGLLDRNVDINTIQQTDLKSADTWNTIMGCDADQLAKQQQQQCETETETAENTEK